MNRSGEKHYFVCAEDIFHHFSNMTSHWTFCFIQTHSLPPTPICEDLNIGPGPEVISFFSCSTQLSMKFQTFITTKMLKITIFLALNPSGILFILLINVKMPTIVGTLTFMSRINFVLSWFEHYIFITSRSRRNTLSNAFDKSTKQSKRHFFASTPIYNSLRRVTAYA